MPAAVRPAASALGLLATAVAGWLVLASGGQAAAATGGWTLTASPTSVTRNVATNVVLTATDAKGGASVGCVQIQLSSAWTVNSVTITSVTAPLRWTVGPVSSGLVTVHAVADTDVLKNPGQFVRFTMNVTGTVVGTYTWNATSLDHANCSAGPETATLTMSVVGGSTPPPAPTPTPPPARTPTPPPARTPTPPPAPTAAHSPTAVPSVPPHRGGTTPTPTPTSSPSPSATQQPSPYPTGTLSVATPTRGLRSPTPTGSPADGNEPRASGQPFWVPGGGSSDMGGLTADLTGAIGFGDVLLWVVPGLALTVPGLLLVLVVAAQALGGAIWLPLARRRIGEFGFGRRRKG